METIRAAGAHPILRRRTMNIPVVKISTRRSRVPHPPTEFVMSGLLALLPGTSPLNESYVQKATAAAPDRELQHPSIARTRARLARKIYNAKN